MPKSACFVTPSYARDFERCRLLSESRTHCAPDVPHYIVVDPHDLQLFRTLEGPNTHVIDAREVLDSSFYKWFGQNGWWLNLRTLPVRGWITQQLRKLAMPRIVDHDILINIDSDVVFTRPFAVDMLFEGNSLGLFEVDYRNLEILKWADTASKLTGLRTPETINNYVGMLIPWWRSNVEALTAAIEAQHNRPWQVTVALQRSFSEYMTYGIFVRAHLGMEGAGHFSDGRKLVQTSWHHNVDSAVGLEALFASAPPEAVAVMVHSKDNVSPAVYRRLVERSWQAPGA